MPLIEELKQRARRLRAETFALYLAARHPDTPWYAKLLVAAIVAYALSPIDLIPDFIPIVGYLDDLVLIPIGIALAIRLVPPAVLAECRARADWLIGMNATRALTKRLKSRRETRAWSAGRVQTPTLALAGWPAAAATIARARAASKMRSSRRSSPSPSAKAGSYQTPV